MKRFIFILALLLVSRAFGQIPVTDSSVFGQVLENVRVATEQLDQLKTELDRLGNPASIKPSSATDLIRSLGTTGVGRTLEELRGLASGAAALHYDGNGLYRPPGEVITTADGSQVKRATESYKKFDAVTQARIAMEDVMHDTEERRQQMRAQIQKSLAQLQAASTLSEVQKLQGILTGQNAELSAIDREREAALNRLLAQHVENQTDAARQELAHREERVADFHAASEKLANFLTPDTTPVHIPDPRRRLP